MEIFNNTTKVVKDDLKNKIQSGSHISIAAACFSIYAYQELKAQLEACDELRFIFTSPTFVAEKTPKERKEFYIPRLKREKSLYGTEFEVRLRNELKQKAVAKECAEWMRKKAYFKSNITHEGMNHFLVVEGEEDSYAYSPMNTFTTVDLGCERGNNLTNMITRMENPASTEFLRMFDSVWNDAAKLSDVTEEVVDMISTVYQENSPELVYFMTLYNIFNEFLEDISEDVLPNEATGFKDSIIWNKLFNFQRDAVLAIINKLEQYNGCILADSVGLGKTFTALAVIKYYEGRNKNVLVLCPKKLSENWMTYRGNLINNPLSGDRLRYDILYHTDLSRDSGNTIIGLPIDRINWGNYDLVVIDESHNFRNGNGTDSKGGEKENRSNMEDVYYKPADYTQEQLSLYADNIKPDRTAEDLLFQVMLDLGVLLSSKIEEEEIAGKKVFSVENGYLIACFDNNVTEETVTEIAKRHPFYAVFRDSGLASDSVAVNFDQLFETYSPKTRRKVL